MSARLRISVLLLASVVGFAANAAEQRPGDVAERWGLIGTWAIDCEAAPDPQNPYYSYVRKGSSLLLRRDMGRLKDENEVISAVIAKDDGIELVTNFKAFSRVMIGHFVRDGADQFHLLSNKDGKGVYTIRDGKQISTGEPAALMTRCLQTDKK